MIATTRTAAGAQSIDFDRSFATSSESMPQFPLTQLFPRPAALGKGQSLIIGDATKQARYFERIGSLRTGRHFSRFLESIQRACVLVAAVRRGFQLHGIRSYVGGTR
jgi:hypothetical protein